jgi:uncharacterized HAD superfamily protein
MKKSIQNIGIDIDDTIMELLPALYRYYEERFGEKFTQEEYTYEFERIWKKDTSEVRKIVDDFLKTPYFREMISIKGSREVIAQLKKDGHKLFAVTARHSKYSKITDYQMKKHFDDAFEGRHFHASQFASDPSKRKTKSQICLENKIQLLVEDSPHHALDCAEKDITVLMYDTPWNQGIILPKNVTRVFNWQEIYEKIKK